MPRSERISKAKPASRKVGASGTKRERSAPRRGGALVRYARERHAELGPAPPRTVAIPAAVTTGQGGQRR